MKGDEPVNAAVAPWIESLNEIARRHAGVGGEFDEGAWLASIKVHSDALSKKAIETTVTASNITASSITASKTVFGGLISDAAGMTYYIPRKEHEALMEKREETVREAISRRVVDAFVAFGLRLNEGDDVRALHVGVTLLYEATLPFLTPDVKRALTESVKLWDEELRQAANREAVEAQLDAAVSDRPPSGMEAW